MTYLDVSARGLISESVRKAADLYLDQRMLEGGDKAWMFARVEGAREQVARLLNASADEIAFSRNISDGLNTIANALPWKSGDNVVICESLEHPANIFPWLNLAERMGIVIRSVRQRDGEIPLESIIDAIDERTRVVTVSSVSFAPGFRFPVAEIGKLCRERHIVTIIDAAQSVGVLHTDVQDLQIDALAASTQKGLMALYGCGFIYVRRSLAETLRPVYLSRTSVALQSSHEASNAGMDDYRLAAGARRFDVGNFNYIAAITLERSLEDLLAIGTRRIEAHACGLAKRLSEGLEAQGVPVFRPSSDAARSHIVGVGNALSDDHDSTSDLRMKRLYDVLADNKVRLTIRRGMLRFSLHAYNNNEDVDRVLDLARRFAASD
jgi:selenocysteine lyase/cysteine desulfurase